VEDDEYDWVLNHPNVDRVRDVLTFRQSMAVVRHGERLDQTPAWLSYPDREAWPLDTPLTAEGRKSAREVGTLLQKKKPPGAAPFDIVVLSPFL
jgi:broad specificity phosphatase PhoE